MASSPPFSYAKLLKETHEEWKREVISVFRCFDRENDGWLPRDEAIHVMSLFGMNGDEHFHFSKKQITIRMMLDSIQHERDRNSDHARRWKYIFYLIADPEKKTITKERLRDFFTMFGYTPEDKYCDDFIDEFDRKHLEKSEIVLEDWLMFCRIHKLPF